MNKTLNLKGGINGKRRCKKIKCDHFEKENGLLLLQNGATINTINMAHNMVCFVVVL